MKKALLFEIKDIARDLPDVPEEYYCYENILGQALIDRGDKYIGDHKVVPKKRYKDRILKIRKINHVQRLKKAYNRNKEAGMVEYIKWAKMQHSKMIKKYPKMFTA